MNIVILGDSFSSDEHRDGWIAQLRQHHQIENLSQRGISQFRIYKLFQKNIDLINKADLFLIWHTNPQRIYLPDDVDAPIRNLSTHSTADMVAEDSMNRHGWKDIAKTYYKYFFDEEQNQIFFDLMVNQIRQCVKTKIIECTGFKNNDSKVKSFYAVKKQHSGCINHMNPSGNRMVYDWIEKQL